MRISREGFFQWIEDHRKEFVKYFVVGFSGVFLDLGLMILLVSRFGWDSVHAVVVVLCIVLAYNFTLNKLWSFGDTQMPFGQIVRYGVVAGLNYGFGVGMMWFFNKELGFDYRLVRIVTIAVMVPFNFVAYKYWVYRRCAQTKNLD